MSVFKIRCAVQTYAWGKLGTNSEVALLSVGADGNFTPEDRTPYAELWMGTHPKGPSVITENGETLSEWISKNPALIGSEVQKQFPADGQLPFLFKVLSVQKSLSIQAHPNKKHAEELHASKPDKYPDSNHKPEMAIALTPFEGMCGFRPRQEIVYFLDNIPEFRSVVGDDLADEYSKITDTNGQNVALRKCFTALMSCNADKIKEKIEKLVTRLNEMESKGVDTSAVEGELVTRLNNQFPGDVGCFCVYFLNHMRLEPGQAMFLEANLPHAYLSGDCIECMACSDNVVRAGLTPKFIDVPVLCEMLKYDSKPAVDNLFLPQTDGNDACVTIYNPPVPDFAVLRIQTPKDKKQYEIGALDSASIVLVIQGEAMGSTKDKKSIPIQRGTVLFMSTKSTFNLAIKSSGMLMFRAYCHL